MELDHLVGAVQEQEEGLVEGEVVVAEWVERAPGQDLAEIVFALAVGQGFLTRWGCPAII